MTGAAWRKSSYSGASGGNCVEVTVWRKSSYSSNSGDNCVEVAVWRKSSHSDNSGGNCVEVATWHKSSHSGNSGDGCVEVGTSAGAAGESGGVVAVRDSKDPDGPKLVLGEADWQAFAARVRSGAFPG